MAASKRGNVEGNNAAGGDTENLNDIRREGIMISCREGNVQRGQFGAPEDSRELRGRGVGILDVQSVPKGS